MFAFREWSGVKETIVGGQNKEKVNKSNSGLVCHITPISLEKSVRPLPPSIYTLQVPIYVVKSET